MDDFIACCGLNCKECEAYIATVLNDDCMRKEVAAKWSAMNNVEIDPKQINCLGCRKDGMKFVYCESMCPIRKCVMTKGLETCGDCNELKSCDKVSMVIGNNADAMNNLTGQK